MLQINNFSITLIKDDRTLIKDLTFSLNQKDKLGLIGEEGNGKSLLLKAIVDEDLISDFCKLEGSINKEGELLGYLPQSHDEEILKLSPKAYLMKELSDNFDYNAYYKKLRFFDLDDYLYEESLTLKDLSGGERIKFTLLTQILKNPSLLLLDEPSNDLDMDAILWLENFIRDIDLPVIFISHDQKLLSACSNRIIHLELIHRRQIPRHTVFSGGYDAYMEYRKSFIENESKRALSDKKDFKEKIDNYHRIYHSVNSALRGTKNDIVGKNLKDKMHTVKSMGKRLEKEKENLRKAPELEDPIAMDFDENISIAKSKTVLDLKLPVLRAGDKDLAYDVDLKVFGAEKVCIIGPNGSGKTSLIKKIVEVLKDSDLRLGYMPQNYFDLEDFDQTALSYLSRSSSKDEHTKISTYLGSLNFTRDDMYKKIKDLSGGQKAKLYFAKMNLDKAEVLVLDEPTRNLSPTSQNELMDALMKYNGPIISASHDRAFIERLGENIYKLDGKKLVRIK